jgi:streptogramin lyase
MTMRRHFIVASAMALVLAGCGGHQALPVPLSNGQSSVHHAKPLVLQTGKSPINWTRFAWGGSTSEATSGDTIVTGPDKNIWYTDYYKPGLVKMTMSGAAHEYLFTGFNPTSMTVGSDGKFYIGEYGVAKIAVVTTSGTVSQKTIPSGDYMYQGGMTLGPDGNVWFAELGHIGMITPAGTITEYAYSDGNTSNYYGGVAKGPDGNVWATEYDEGLIDKVVPSTGAQTKYTLGCTPYSVTAAKGDLYVNCGNDIAQVTTAGVVTLFPLDLSSSAYGDLITVGPDGDPWFTTLGTSGYPIGEFNPATNSETFYYPPSSYAIDNALVTGPDGNLWAIGSSTVDVYIVSGNVISVSPNSVTFTATSQQQSVTVTESGATSWTAKSEDTAIATVAQGSPADTFTISSVSIGQTKVIIMDSKGNSFAVHVTVQ